MSEKVDEFICCQDCGRIIYYDKDMKEPVTSVDDISAPPYITASGDLFCCLCGPAYDESDEEDDYDLGYDPAEEADYPKTIPEKEAS